MRGCRQLVLSGLIAALAVGTGFAQDAATQKAWDILNKAVAEPSGQNRSQAVAALGLIKKDSQAQALATKALNDAKPEVRVAGANALGEMLATESIPQLTAALKDKDVSVVLAAAHSLHALKQPVAYEVYYAILTKERKSGQGLVEEQKKMLSDPKKMAQFGFEQGIGFVPFAGLGLGVLKAVTKDDVSPVRAAAAKILAHDSDPRSGEALVKAASDKSWIVRAAALDAIAHSGDPALATRIAPQLDDEKDVVRYVAAAAIIQLSGGTAVKD